MTLLLACATLGCQEAAPPAAPAFRLQQVRPRRDQRVGVFLNEALVFHFSDALDAASVTSESLAVREVQSGRVASGNYEVEDDHVRFQPDLGRERELSDGGFVPGQRYEVVLRGFPSPDGLRSSDGRVLARSHRIEFETVVLSEPRGQLFEDRSPLMGEPLLPEALEVDLGGSTVRVERGESIIMVCAEPLDPSTLVDGEFVLIPLGSPGDSSEGAAQPPEDEASGSEIPLDLRLLENSFEGGARLELKPRRRLADGSYSLSQALEVSLRDFGGNDVWYAAVPGAKLTIAVYDEGAARPEHVESFTSTDLSLPFAIPGADGTAYWAGDGRVTVRWPKAAGLGTAGAVQLSGAEARRDIQATSLVLERDDECELLTVPGLLVLRTQGELSISGSLRRRCGEGPGIPKGQGEELSRWLERASAENSSWTVLIAGGDLVIDGSVDVDGPLLLAAGGRIRVSGEVRAQERELWYVGDGGGPSLRTASRAELELDPPYRNPLVEPLTFALVSGPMPPEGGVLRWIDDDDAVRSLDRGGQARVQFIPEDFPILAPTSEWGIVDNPSELLSSDSLRLFITLTVYPAEDGKHELWDPPLVDEVRLFWEARAR